MACQARASKQQTQAYESYLAPRVAAVQSERRPTAVTAAAAAAAAAAASSSAEVDPVSVPSSKASVTAAAAGLSLYGMYGDSPTMLPRTPIAPETLLASASGAGGPGAPSPLLASSRASPLGGASSFTSSSRAVDAESRHSTENGSSNGDVRGVDASAVLAAREKSLISRSVQYTRTYSIYPQILQIGIGFSLILLLS